MSRDCPDRFEKQKRWSPANQCLAAKHRDACILLSASPVLSASTPAQRSPAWSTACARPASAGRDVVDGHTTPFVNSKTTVDAKPTAGARQEFDSTDCTSCGHLSREPGTERKTASERRYQTQIVCCEITTMDRPGERVNEPRFSCCSRCLFCAPCAPLRKAASDWLLHRVIFRGPTERARAGSSFALAQTRFSDRYHSLR